MPAGLLALGIVLAIQVVLGVVACLLAGKLTGADFGLLLPGCMKLAAICVFPGAVTGLIPWGCAGYILGLLLYWGLLEWLFGLDPMETITTVVVMWAVNAGAVLLAAAALAAMK